MIGFGTTKTPKTVEHQKDLNEVQLQQLSEVEDKKLNHKKNKKHPKGKSHRGFAKGKKHAKLVVVPPIKGTVKHEHHKKNANIVKSKGTV
jgi:hypothetical protein